MRRREADQARLRLGADARRAFVADLAARAGRRTRERRDRRRMIVRLDLHQDVRRLAMRGVAAIRVRIEARRPSRLRSPPRCPHTRRAFRADAPRALRESSRTGVCACGSPSMSQLALKILCRQCSEFACANIVSSTSVGSRPRRVNAAVEVVDLVRRQREAERGVCRARAPRGPAARSGMVVSGRGATCANNRRASATSSSTASVIRSWMIGSSAARSSSVKRLVIPSRQLERDAALDAADGDERAVARDVGRFRRPRRDRAEARVRPAATYRSPPSRRSSGP